MVNIHSIIIGDVLLSSLNQFIKNNVKNMCNIIHWSQLDFKKMTQHSYAERASNLSFERSTLRTDI
jgi:ABC-type enterochelin transport system permease subunit